jgi:hypothetical protein
MHANCPAYVTKYKLMTLTILDEKNFEAISF